MKKRKHEDTDHNVPLSPLFSPRQNHPNWKRLTKVLTLLRKAWLKSWRGWGCRAAGKFLIFHPRKTGLSLQHGGKKRARHFFGPFLLFHMPPHVQANLHAVSLSFQGKFPVCREWGWAWNYLIDTDLFLDGDARTAFFFTKTFPYCARDLGTWYSHLPKRGIQNKFAHCSHYRFLTGNRGLPQFSMWLQIIIAYHHVLSSRSHCKPQLSDSHHL